MRIGTAELQALRRLPGDAAAEERRALLARRPEQHVSTGNAAGLARLLDELLAWSTQERFRYTHEWRQDDLVIWDNTGILHRALPYDPSSERRLHRTTIVGDEELA